MAQILIDNVFTNPVVLKKANEFIQLVYDLEPFQNWDEVITALTVTLGRMKDDACGVPASQYLHAEIAGKIRKLRDGKRYNVRLAVGV